MTNKITITCAMLLIAITSMASSCEDNSHYEREILDRSGSIYVDIEDSIDTDCVPYVTVDSPVHSITIKNQQGDLFARVECVEQQNCLHGTDFHGLPFCDRNGQIPADSAIGDVYGREETDQSAYRGCITNGNWWTEYNERECNNIFIATAIDVEHCKGTTKYLQYFVYDEQDWGGASSQEDQ